MTQLATTQDSPIATASAAMMMNPAHMQALVGFAKMMADSAVTVPKHLQGKPADCLAIAMQAAQWGMNPFAVAQKTHVVNGTLGYEAQLVNAVIQSSGAIRGAFKYEYRGDGNALECRVGAVLAGDSEVTWGEWLCIGVITTKNSPLWKTNPKQQIGYLQVKNWARSFCPGAILGVYTDDELMDSPEPIVKNMGKAEQVLPTQPERATYPTEQFEKNLPTWKGLIVAGKKTAEQIIATVESKATLTEAQKAKIRSCAEAATVVDAATGEVQQQSAANHPLATQMDRAEDVDDLNALADEIRGIDDDEVAKHLRNVYQANLQRLTKE